MREALVILFRKIDMQKMCFVEATVWEIVDAIDDSQPHELTKRLWLSTAVVKHIFARSFTRFWSELRIGKDGVLVWNYG